MNYSLIFLDIDGTVKQEPNMVSDANKEAILTACLAGKKVTIASGRNKDLVLQIVRELKLDEFGESYSLALNGAHIIENRTGKTLRSEPISSDLIYLLFHKADDLKLDCHCYTENYIYFNKKYFIYDWYDKQDCSCALVTMSKPDLALKEMPLKFFLYSEDPTKLEEFREDVSDSIKDILNADYSTPNCLEFTSVGASKGLGMTHVCELLNLPLSEAIAIGDGGNDISMITMAGLGVAMKNAPDSVKAIANTVTKRTCIEDGVAEIIQEYLLS